MTERIKAYNNMKDIRKMRKMGFGLDVDNVTPPEEETKPEPELVEEVENKGPLFDKISKKGRKKLRR